MLPLPPNPGAGKTNPSAPQSAATLLRFQVGGLLTRRFPAPYRFLLKYASRDEVDILGHGNGGISELRDAVAAYDETNPLYGFLKYRRRKVLIKYLPEGCSRLIQGAWRRQS
jgi:hypothetical protein